MFEFFPLSKWSWQEIVQCFSAAFVDYVVEVNPDVDYVKKRSESARVDLDLSIGAADPEGQLVGLMLLGVGPWQNRKTAFNVGTGVIPESRGNRLVVKMYEWLMPRFRARSVERLGLEVIQSNERAIRAYRSAGFEITREFDCYSGTVTRPVDGNPENYQIEILETPDWDRYRTLPGFEVSWEHTQDSIARQPELRTLEIRQMDEVVAFALFHPSTGAIPQFRFRDHDTGLFLFSELGKRLEKLKLNNVRSGHTHSTRVLDQVGLECPLKQFEMWREV